MTEASASDKGAAAIDGGVDIIAVHDGAPMLPDAVRAPGRPLRMAGIWRLAPAGRSVAGRGVASSRWQARA